ncbi:MAG: DUF1080 domain-containing protein [Deltaproteobacteria bacterium]|nr:DUF1080 domain-containing protein [Deltaproteobacteria bacterium]MBW2393636.1 DUF1080 domain-containing protein [Deltaproteobacteria bacterium]
MGYLIRAVLIGLVGFALGCFGQAALEPAEAGADFPVQGEYSSRDPALGAQVVARGGGTFSVSFFDGGLPGAGADLASRQVFEGAWEGSSVLFDGPWQLRIEADMLHGVRPAGDAFSLPKIQRESPTLGALPPEGAVVLFDGKGPGGFDGEVDSRGLLEAGAESREAFGSFDLHLEFRTPFMPTSSGQGRGNSGVYLQNRYEVQVLDSFGEVGEWNECGGIYEVAKPDVNMALPPLAWQTYDISFRAARFGDDGKKLAAARVTVRHNGVVIHYDVELPGPTGLGDEESAAPGPLHLQDHWDPVFYRNVWLVPRPLL